MLSDAESPAIVLPWLEGSEPAMCNLEFCLCTKSLELLQLDRGHIFKEDEVSCWLAKQPNTGFLNNWHVEVWK
jgi:hypothetical protein